MSQQQQDPIQPRILRPRLQSRNLTSPQRVAVLEEKLNGEYRFRDDLLALESLQDTNMPLEIHDRMRAIPNNKDLAILGDILLDLHICIGWMQTDDSRDTFEKSKQRIVRNENLERVGKELGLDECIIRNGGPVQPVGRIAMASTVEAIIGAVWKDAEKHRKGTGYQAAFNVATGFGLVYSSN